MNPEDWLKKQRELYSQLPDRSPPFSTHPVSGEWQVSDYLTQRFWWGGGASRQALAQLEPTLDRSPNNIGVITFGPVQSFLGGGQRLRDWAVASWLCHYLTGVLIYRWEERGGQILLPLYRENSLINWLRGESASADTFWRAEFPNVVTGFFPDRADWFEESLAIIQTEWQRFTSALETASIEHNSRLGGIGWRVIHQDHQHLWSISGEQIPFNPDSLIEDIQSLHRTLEARKIGRTWEGIWWGGDTSPGAGCLSIWHPGLKPVTDGGIWGLPRENLNQWWETRAEQDGYGLFSQSDRLNSIELLRRLSSIPDIIQPTLENLWGKAPPACPWGTFPDRTAVAATWIKDAISPERWNESVEFLDEYFLSHSPPKSWGMPGIDRLAAGFAHPRGLERRNIDKEQTSEWEEIAPKGWESSIEWTVGWRGDGDNLGQWLSGEQYRKQRLSWSRWHPDAATIEREGLDISPPDAGEEARQIELPHVLDISILLNYWSRLLYPLTQECHDGKVIFAGGDDFLLLGPITEAISLTTDLHKLWTGEDTPLTRSLVPPVNGWVQQGDTVYPVPGRTMSFSLGVVIAQRRVPQSLWHRGLNEAYKKAKTLGRDRVCVRVLFNSGQSLEWVCPWRLWDRLMSVEPSRVDRTDLNVWEKLLYYLESTRLREYELFTVRDLLETLWASVGLDLTWEEIERCVITLRQFEGEIGRWEWWTNWISLRSFLCRQQREREKWIERVNR